MDKIVERSNKLGVKTNKGKFSPFETEQKFIGFIWNGPVNTTFMQCETGLADACRGSLILHMPAEKLKSRCFESQWDPSQVSPAPAGPTRVRSPPHRSALQIQQPELRN
ncbi:hypothetical protein PCANC_01903 [Puccinia coronata f. sp. avenae]|uniref:Uncharacterized protein n=1 Tax=Puccinia coronata f. sp. avenae TaxID=200324 RepID=A0A2N5W4B0_9BASI|nr:hypothetical protein PCANC_01903 [Puccinia coronata f. sp. avenae]